jgi:drug/metabolite transporter (DMT)-like permease
LADRFGRILLGAVVLSWGPAALTFSVGTLAIVGACLCWGIDNNLTRKLSSADPTMIAMLKGLVAGSVNFALAVSQGAPIPKATLLVSAAFVGFVGYGVSLVLFVLALRHLGSAPPARTLLLLHSLVPWHQSSSYTSR